MKNPKPNTGFMLILGLCLIVTSCSTQLEPEISQRAVLFKDHLMSLVSGEPCEATCWHGIMPDVSSKDEVLGVLNSMAFLQTESIQVVNAGLFNYETQERVLGERITSECQFPTTGYCVTIGLIDGTVTYISLAGDENLTLGELVNVFGNPDFVTIFPEGMEDYNCVIEVFWQPKQLSAVYVESDFDEAAEMCNLSAFPPEISPFFHLNRVHILSASSLDWFREMEFAFPWPGLTE